MWLFILLDTAKHVWIGTLLPYQLPNTICVYLILLLQALGFHLNLIKLYPSILDNRQHTLNTRSL